MTRAMIIWPLKAKTTVRDAPTIGKSKILDVIKTTPSIPPVQSHHGLLVTKVLLFVNCLKITADAQ